MQIYGPAHLHGPQAIAAPHHSRSSAPALGAPTSFSADEVNISDAGRLVDLASQLPEVRADRVRDLRSAIASGKYDTEARLSAALDRFLDEVA